MCWLARRSSASRSRIRPTSSKRSKLPDAFAAMDTDVIVKPVGAAKPKKLDGKAASPSIVSDHVVSVADDGSDVRAVTGGGNVDRNRIVDSVIGLRRLFIKVRARQEEAIVTNAVSRTPQLHSNWPDRLER